MLQRTMDVRISQKAPRGVCGADWVPWDMSEASGDAPSFRRGQPTATQLRPSSDRPVPPQHSSNADAFGHDSDTQRARAREDQRPVTTSHDQTVALPAADAAATRTRSEDEAFLLEFKREREKRAWRRKRWSLHP